MKIKNIIFETEGGEDIKDAIRQAYNYSFENNVEVSFIFNNFEVRIKPF